MILYPAIDLKDGKCVRLLRGEMKPEDDTLVRDAKWRPFVPAIPVSKEPIKPDPAP